MAFQIGANVTALNVYNNLGTQQAKASTALAKVSSGLKAAGGVDVGSQGAATSINIKFQETQASISQVQNAIGHLQVADQTYAEMIALAQKGLEAGKTGSVTSADFSGIANTMKGVQLGLAAFILNAQYNGVKIDQGAMAPDAGASTYTVTITLPATTDLATDVDAAVAAAGSGTVGTATTEFETYIGLLVDGRAKNAGNLAAMQGVLQVLNSAAANELAALAQAQDVDIAKEMMSLTSANIMTEAATAMLAQAMQLPNQVLKLLQ